jgi:hypothetical protein
MNINRPSTRVRASPGGKTSICFGDEFAGAVASTTEAKTETTAGGESTFSCAFQVINSYDNHKL